MEAVVLHGSWDNHKSHVKNPEKIHQPSISRSYDYNLFPSNFHSMGFLQAPPPFLPHNHLRPPQQPPLLPLPAAHPRLAITGRALSLPPANKNSNRARDNSLTPKKSKSPHKNLKKQETIKKSPKLVRSQEAVVSSSTSGPFSITTDNAHNVKAVENIEIINHADFFGSKIFTTSPSPSSLPLPTFCLRPKLKCSAAAAGLDNGATDNLRQLLQLQ